LKKDHHTFGERISIPIIYLQYQQTQISNYELHHLINGW